MSIQAKELKREQIVEIIRRHPGTQTRIAEELGVRDQSVSNWMRDKGGSARVEEACRKHAARLLREEEKAAAEKAAPVV